MDGERRINGKGSRKINIEFKLVGKQRVFIEILRNCVKRIESMKM